MKKNIIIKILLNNKGFIWWLPLVTAALGNSDNQTARMVGSALSTIKTPETTKK